MATWRAQYLDLSRTVDPIKLTQLGVVALTQISAILAVDAGMTPEKFLAVCKAQFTEAYKRAPRFG